MSGDHFLSFREIDHFLEYRPANLRDIVLELRNLVVGIAPTATERIVGDALTYHDAARGGPVKAGICQILIERDHVRLAFIHGAFLDDPKQLLQGERLAKRFAVISSYENAPWEALQSLIMASAKFDPASLYLGSHQY